MAGGFASVDVQGMAQAQEQMQTIHGELNSAVQDLEEQQSTLAANWSGEAQSIFGQALQAFVDDFNQIINSLFIMMEVLSQNTQIYVNANDTSKAAAMQLLAGTPADPNYSPGQGSWTRWSQVATPASSSGTGPGLAGLGPAGIAKTRFIAQSTDPTVLAARVPATQAGPAPLAALGRDPVVHGDSGPFLGSRVLWDPTATVQGSPSPVQPDEPFQSPMARMQGQGVSGPLESREIVLKMAPMQGQGISSPLEFGELIQGQPAQLTPTQLDTPATPVSPLESVSTASTSAAFSAVPGGGVGPVS
jgi:WXG100 family type VII secretion target